MQLHFGLRFARTNRDSHEVSMRRLAWTGGVLLGLGLFLCGEARGVIIALTPLSKVLKEHGFIFTAKGPNSSIEKNASSGQSPERVERMRSSFLEYSGSLDVSTTRAFRQRYPAAFVIFRITSGQAPASLPVVAVPHRRESWLLPDQG